VGGCFDYVERRVEKVFELRISLDRKVYHNVRHSREVSFQALVRRLFTHLCSQNSKGNLDKNKKVSYDKFHGNDGFEQKYLQWRR
jgi:hypothetical protein